MKGSIFNPSFINLNLDYMNEEQKFLIEMDFSKRQFLYKYNHQD